METENRLASLNESAPLRCQPRLGAPQSCFSAGPSALRPPSRWHRTHAGEAEAQPWAAAWELRPGLRKPCGTQCISRARGASPSGWSPRPSRSGPESSLGRPAGRLLLPPLPRSPDRGRHWCRCALQSGAHGRATARVCKESRRAAVRSGAEPRGACEPVSVCAWMRGEAGSRGGRGLSTRAAYSSAQRQRGRAGQFQEPAAASRALADTGKACDWPAAAPMQTS